MKKSAKLSLAMALLAGATTGLYTIAPPQEASAEISDKFRMEINGYQQYVVDNDGVGFKYYDSNGKRKSNYWSNQTRLVISYHLDKNVKMQARLHNNYDNVGDFMKNQNDTGAFFDQTFLEIKDPVAKTTYTIGKKGAYMGQGMVYNSTGNLTGVAVQVGDWWAPNNIAVYYGDRKNGDRIKAVNGHVGLGKKVDFSVLYLDAVKSRSYFTPYTDVNTKGKTYHKVGSSRVYDNTRAYTNYALNGEGTYRKLHILSYGTKVKFPEVTLVGEYSHNLNGEGLDHDTLKGWYAELYTGPTTDMTSGLPLCKPGTNVWSLKYQDIGKNSVYTHNPTFVDDMKGWRLTYGHTFRKGLSTDIAWGHYERKSTGEKNRDIYVAELAYKFR